MVICTCWAMSAIVAKIVVGEHHVPPLFFSAVRSAVVAAVTLPWLLPMPRPHGRILIIAFLLGCCGFTLLFLGIRTSTPSSVAIVSQLSAPLTTLLAVVVLGERLGVRRGAGVVLALAGVVTVIWNPATMQVSTGLFYVAASAAAGSVGAIMLKQVETIRPLQLQAWVGLVAIAPVGLLSGLLEVDQVARMQEASWVFLAGVLFSALVVSVFSHTLFYAVLRRNDAAAVAPLLVMSPIITVALGILVTHDTVTAQLLVGGAIALAGGLVIVLPERRRSEALEAPAVNA